MVSSVGFCDDQFDGSAKEFEWLQVLKLRVDEPLLQRPRKKDSGDHKQVINGPIADIDAKGHCHCPSDYQQPRDQVAEVAAGSLRQRNLRAESGHLVRAWSRIFYRMRVGSKIEK